MQGILRRTKEPKLEVAKPTENAKNKEKITENNNNGFSPSKAKKPKNFNLIIRKTVSNNI